MTNRLSSSSSKSGMGVVVGNVSRGVDEEMVVVVVDLNLGEIFTSPGLREFLSGLSLLLELLTSSSVSSE